MNLKLGLAISIIVWGWSMFFYNSDIKGDYQIIRTIGSLGYVLFGILLLPEIKEKSK